MHIDIEWDATNAAGNLRKHRVSFEEAATVLLDPAALAREDDSSHDEPRWVIVGMSERARLLTVVYALRGADRIRLISARRATRSEAGEHA
jgi:uncharacterized DUF497 family protein